jgi:hypothetical protein
VALNAGSTSTAAANGGDVYLIPGAGGAGGLNGGIYLYSHIGSGLVLMELTDDGIGEFGTEPTPQSVAIPDASGGVVIDAEARAALNTLLAYFRLRGTIAT